MDNTHYAPKWKTLLAFGIIYFVWGATFFAIRVGVREVPPLLFCAMRFVAAGLLVYLWASAKKEQQPTARQWLSVFLLAFLIFVIDYGSCSGRKARALGNCGHDYGDDSGLYGAF